MWYLKGTQSLCILNNAILYSVTKTGRQSGSGRGYAWAYVVWKSGHIFLYHFFILFWTEILLIVYITKYRYILRKSLIYIHNIYLCVYTKIRKISIDCLIIQYNTLYYDYRLFNQNFEYFLSITRKGTYFLSVNILYCL